MSPHYSKGSADTYAFVFSCPGQLEEKAKHPAAGKTGRNFEALLLLLSPHLGVETLTRDSVTITNAWPNIEYEGTTNRSEADDTEILEDANIDRLAIELGCVTKMIVFCGDKAAVALKGLEEKKLLAPSIQVAFVEHLGTRGLNRIKVDFQQQTIDSAEKQRREGRRDSVGEIQAENTSRRLNVVAQRLLEGIRSLSYKEVESNVSVERVAP